ncbi:hypothetical protein DEO72_LG1g2149 [Vigna unguiculata]|uniref:Uncharacterized protein n=1 Tax=Vigna unguiculata TaxID=3917 RepID=A0A4D6KXN6_VIGUN|nr:hypothetical protein DEO72_LG1g2149 [Vigna unguiculata]
MATTMYTDAPHGRLITFPPHGHHHDYQTRQQNTEEANPSGPIRTVHSQHTPIGNTHQPEPQLKVPRVHPLARATTQGKSFDDFKFLPSFNI